MTLVETLEVIVIIGVAIGTVGTCVIADLAAAEQETATIHLQQLANAVERARALRGRYPSEDEGLDALTTKDTEGGPVMSEVPGDPWGYRYRYANPPTRGGVHFDLWSVGPDGQDGTNDDLGNWQLDERGVR